jgi:hypothetical protein
MGNITLNGATSGQITVTPTAVAGTNTITVAAQTGTLNVAGPAFHATAAGTQTITSSTFTKATLTEDFDTNNNFASSTFTPTVAGYYQINAAVTGTGTVMTNVTAAIYKNGTLYSQVYGAGYTGAAGAAMCSDIVYCNGSTDYIELYARINATGTPTVNSATYFSGSLVRGA